MFYTLGIYLYGVLLRIASLFSSKAKKWVDGRKGFWKNVPNLDNENVIWFHCASLGEYDQGKPIMEEWKKKHPNDFLLVTFFSPSGYENVKNKSIGDYTCYLPLDTPRNAKRFIQWAQPKMAFFVKYEIWANHIFQATKSDCRLFLVSAVFRGSQHFFKWWGWTSRHALRKFEHIFVQYEFNLSLLFTIDIHCATVSGDTRYDRVIERVSNKNENPVIASWKGENAIFVMGSVWPKDEEMILPYVNERSIKEKVMLAPHEVNRKHVDWIKSQLTCSYQCYNDIQNGEELRKETNVLILDCIGVLADAYQYGTIAYVGGGFGTGLHNILEPAVFGLPVIFGPLHHKFLEAQEFIDSGIGASVGSGPYFIQAYRSFLSNSKLPENIQQFIASKLGATERIVGYFEEKNH